MMKYVLNINVLSGGLLVPLLVRKNETGLNRTINGVKGSFQNFGEHIKWQRA